METELTPNSKHYVESNDLLVVPFKQYFVTVAGAVKNPGRYPYLPDRSWSYYVGLAGGFDELKNKNQKIDIRNKDGEKLELSDVITSTISPFLSTVVIGTILLFTLAPIIL